MNNVSKGWIGVLLVLLATTATFFVTLPSNDVFMKVTKTSTSFSVNESGNLVVVGVENVYLYNGTKKLVATSKDDLSSVNDGGIVRVVKGTRYGDSLVKETYTYNSTLLDVESFPVSHTIEVYNAKGLILDYEVSKLFYNGSNRVAISPELFGKNMKVEWEQGSYYSKLSKISSGGKLVVKYKVNSDYERYNVRLFDPSAAINLTIGGLTKNTLIELGSVVNLSATTNATVCIDFNHPSYGVNYSCGANSTSFNSNVTWFRTTTLSTGVTSMNLTVNSTNNVTFNVTSHKYDEPLNLSFNITGYNVSTTYPSNLKIYLNNTLIRSLGNVSITSSQNFNLTTFSDSTSSKNIVFSTGVINTSVYVYMSKLSVFSSNITFNVTGSSAFTGYCFQESVNVSNQTGIDGGVSLNCSVLNYTGSYNVSSGYGSPENVSDGNYSTSANAPAGLKTINFTYVIPSGTNTARMRIKFSNATDFSNVTIIDSCISGRTSLVLMMNRSSDSNNNLWCYNGTWNIIPGNNWTIPSASDGNFYEESVYWNISEETYSSWIELGSIDGTRDWNYTGIFNSSSNTSFSPTPLTSYIGNCTGDSNGSCLVPFHVYSNTPGNISISGLVINYTLSYNPFVINSSQLQSYLDTLGGSGVFPLKFVSSSTGVIMVNDVKYDYRGGNKTYNVLGHDAGYTTNKSYNLTFYYSDWNYSLPSNTLYVEFIPKTATSKNVTPYHQTNLVPIFNFTYYGYGGNFSNFSVRLNQTDTCVNWSISTNNDVSNKIILTTSDYVLFGNKTYLYNTGLWMWADYNCNSSRYLVKTPKLIMSACCSGCDICSTS